MASHLDSVNNALGDRDRATLRELTYDLQVGRAADPTGGRLADTLDRILDRLDALDDLQAALDNAEMERDDQAAEVDNSRTAIRKALADLKALKSKAADWDPHADGDTAVESLDALRDVVEDRLGDVITDLACED